MKRVLQLLLMLLATAAYADGPQLRVEAQLIPDSKVSLGATLALQLDVLTDTWFTAAPQLPALQLPGTRVAEPAGSPVHLTVERDGQTFFGLRYQYRITPRQAQRFEIPALKVSAQVGQATATLHANSRPLSFGVSPAPDDGARLVADSVQLQQVLRPPVAAFQVGDSLERRVELRVRGAPMELLPPAEFAAVEGTRQYPNPVRLQELDDGRGHSDGALRVDSVAYQFERAGRIELPPLELRWRQASNGELHVEQLPGLTLEVAAPPPSVNHRAWRDRLGLWIERHALAALLLIAGLALAWHWLAVPAAAALRWLQRLVSRLRQRYRHSEHRAWRRLHRQLQQRPARLDGLYLWLQRQQVRSTELQRTLRLLYGSTPDAERGLRVLRGLLPELRRQRGERQPRPPALRKLNP
ncbi:BatD family protein [Pseudomonas sp. PDM20]|uniref:BatD family protein n=1 Tax=Pseudomonas sp. PDM20 TaxID=2769254 RepID=UPI00177BF2A7|nr:BatD family protein [Pseudomonas sp. PDM20]MBD9683914.1 BatD family protein [Pseudomonas sp. PDM20]